MFVRKALGSRLKDLRLAAGKTYADVKVIGSPTKMRRIEAGEPPIRMSDVRALCFMFDADPATTEQLAEMSMNMEEDWWEDYNDVLPTWLGRYVALESISSNIIAWDAELVHGLLQTPDYYRALDAAEITPRPGDLESKLGLRAQRQKTAFSKKPPFRITTILGEGALARLIGGREVMAAQVAHLLTLSQGEHVDVFVLPWDTGAHTALGGSFTIMGNDEPDYPDVVYLETLSGARYIEKRDIVEKYRRRAAVLQSQAVTLKEYLS